MIGDIVETTYLGQDAIQVRNGHLSATLLPQRGSNLISLKFNNMNVFREPETVEQFDASPVLYGMPILFPPNRIEGGTFTFNGRTYHFDINEAKLLNHLHGFLCGRPWRLVQAYRQGDAVIVKTRFDSSEFSDVLRQFPHRFLVEVTYYIYENAVRTIAKVSNQDSSPFPFGLGYHTNFNFPFFADGAVNQLRFNLSVYKQWELNRNMIPTGVLMESPILRELESGTGLPDVSLDHAFMSSVVRDGRNEAVLHDLYHGIKITRYD